VDLALHLHLQLDHLADLVVAVGVEFLVQVLGFPVLFLEPGEGRFDIGGRDRLAAGLRFLAQQDPLDHVLPRPFGELGLPPGGLHLRERLLVAGPQPLYFLLNVAIFDSFAVDDDSHVTLLSVPNPKFETRNPKQAQMTKAQNSKQTTRRATAFLSFEVRSFGFVSDFVLRISCFGFRAF
jgi:hypothetical protein